MASMDFYIKDHEPSIQIYKQADEVQKKKTELVILVKEKIKHVVHMKRYKN